MKRGDLLAWSVLLGEILVTTDTTVKCTQRGSNLRLSRLKSATLTTRLKLLMTVLMKGFTWQWQHTEVTLIKALKPSQPVLCQTASDEAGLKHIRITMDTHVHVPEGSTLTPPLG